VTCVLREGLLGQNFDLRYPQAWNNNWCYPGQQRLAKDIGMSIGRVNQFIKELEAAQLIEVKKREQGKTNIYTVKFRRFESLRTQKRLALALGWRSYFPIGGGSP
jgi:DNA-binding MarR family transcriptional regulator